MLDDDQGISFLYLLIGRDLDATTTPGIGLVERLPARSSLFLFCSRSRQKEFLPQQLPKSLSRSESPHSV